MKRYKLLDIIKKKSGGVFYDEIRFT
ncbi:hypothetical protein CNEO_42334 [Clostridium neonatale]|uniref:Uncharacterized protein n=1 Tax=Clostridium neonatale TaxID=137838 RepID=A0AA86MJN9_9CLOT|nr:hypothetical protein CNEO_42334 [Clostridium neonatale]